MCVKRCSNPTVQLDLGCKSWAAAQVPADQSLDQRRYGQSWETAGRREEHTTQSRGLHTQRFLCNLRKQSKLKNVSWTPGFCKATLWTETSRQNTDKETEKQEQNRQPETETDVSRASLASRKDIVDSNPVLWQGRRSSPPPSHSLEMSQTGRETKQQAGTCTDYTLIKRKRDTATGAPAACVRVCVCWGGSGPLLPTEIF